MKTTVSVAVPCYNQGGFLPECLESLRAQTFEDWDAVVVDDASPDGDLIAEVVAGIGDRRIRLIRHDNNRGPAAARNTGIRNGSGHLIVYVDADDKVVPEFLEVLVKPLLEDPEVDCAFGDTAYFGARSDWWPQRLPKPGEILTFMPFAPGGSVLRRSVWDALGGYDESTEVNGREDWEFFIRVFSQGRRAVHIPQKLYYYRAWSQSLHASTKKREIDIREAIYRKHRALYDHWGAGPGFLASGYETVAGTALVEGDRMNAVVLAARACVKDPCWRRLRFLFRCIAPQRLMSAVYRHRERKGECL